MGQHDGLVRVEEGVCQRVVRGLGFSGSIRIPKNARTFLIILTHLALDSSRPCWFLLASVDASESVIAVHLKRRDLPGTGAVSGYETEWDGILRVECVVLVNDFARSCT